MNPCCGSLAEFCVEWAESAKEVEMHTAGCKASYRLVCPILEDWNHS